MFNKKLAITATTFVQIFTKKQQMTKMLTILFPLIKNKPLRPLRPLQTRGEKATNIYLSVSTK